MPGSHCAKPPPLKGSGWVESCHLFLQKWWARIVFSLLDFFCQLIKVTALHSKVTFCWYFSNFCIDKKKKSLCHNAFWRYCLQTERHLTRWKRERDFHPLAQKWSFEYTIFFNNDKIVILVLRLSAETCWRYKEHSKKREEREGALEGGKEKEKNLKEVRVSLLSRRSTDS